MSARELLSAWRRRPTLTAGLLACVLLAAATPVGAGEPRVTLQMGAASLPVGGQALLTVTLEGFSQRAGKPQFPSTDGLEVHESGRSTNMSWVNGSFASSITYNFVVRARREGSYTIGPAQVEDKGRAYRSETVSLQVTPAASGATGAPGGAQRAPAHGDDARADGRGLFARVLVEPHEVVLDQQVTVRFRLYQRADVTLLDVGGFEPPRTEGFWREDLGAQRDFSVTIDGAAYHVREIAWALFPTRTGELEIGPGRVVCQVPAGRGRSRDPFSGFFGRSLFDAQTVPLETEPVRVRVRPLPEEGRPSGFSGSVGDYAVGASIDTPEPRQGEPFTLTLSVRGTGHIQTIGQPVWPDWAGLRVYDSGEGVSVAARDDRLAGEKSFKQVLVPQRAGTMTIDPVRFVYFDPLRQRYATKTTAPIALRVLPAGAGGGGGSGAAGAGELGEDMLYIHTGIASGLRPRAAAGLGAGHLVHLAPLLLIGAGWIGRGRRLAFERDPVRRRRAGALGGARKRIAARSAAAEERETASLLSETIEEYLDAWLAQPARGMLRSELPGRLADAGLGEALIGRLLALLEWCDDVRYGAGGGAPPPAQRRAEALELLAAIDGSFRAADSIARRSGASGREDGR